MNNHTKSTSCKHCGLQIDGKPVHTVECMRAYDDERRRS